MDREQAEAAANLTHELTTIVDALDKTLGELAVITKILHGGFKTLTDLSARMNRNIFDPPTGRHALEVDDAGHGQSSEILDHEPS